MQVEALIFDLDGTLIDSAPDLRAALNDLVVGELGRRPLTLAEVQQMIGDGAAVLVQRALDAVGHTAPLPAAIADLTRRFLALYDVRAAQGSLPYPGVEAALETLRSPRSSPLGPAGARLALCTNKPLRPTWEILEQRGWSAYFDVVVGGDSLKVRKPRPEPLWHILEALQVPPARAVMVGDSPTDAEAAHAAGVPFVAVRYGYSRLPVASLGAAVVLDDLRDLPAWLLRAAAPGEGGGGSGQRRRRG